MSNRSPRFIVVEGPIGVGKTTLARRLAETLGAELVLEKPEENPFLPRFYEDPVTQALPTQLYFLFQRAQQLRDLQQYDLFNPLRVADFLIDKDPLFARLNLSEDEFALYQQAWEHVGIARPYPDLVIYLQAPVSHLVRRIAKRDRMMERGIDSAYLERLNHAYTELFFRYEASPLLIVNTESINPVDSDEDFEMILDYVRNLRPGRHYLNVHGDLF